MKNILILMTIIPKLKSMTSRDFAYWLQGYFEITDPKTIGESETQMIRKHLSLVFKHEIDPSMGDEKHQEKLNEVHNGNGWDMNTKLRC